MNCCFSRVSSFQRRRTKNYISISILFWLDYLKSKKLEENLFATFEEKDTIKFKTISKLLMKRCFTQAGARTAEWKNSGNKQEILNWADQVGYPIISKSYFGSRGIGNKKHDNNINIKSDSGFQLISIVRFFVNPKQN